MLRHGCGRSPGAQDGFEPTIILRLQRLTERSLHRLQVSLVTQIVIRAVHSFDWTRSQHEPSELASKQARATLPLQPVTPESRQICGKIKTEKMRREQGTKCPLGAAEDIPRFAVAAAPMVRHLRKLHLLRGR